ncbi:MAG TPA: homoserine O-acetyltransferase [Bdellovibrio sp.]|nr:homoserine O-acetyltransferase [Bdellovibrio sp.]
MNILTLRLPEHRLPEKTSWLKEKKSFHLPEHTTVLGEKISDVKIGFETYGTLNEAKDNAILICHYFSGSSNAAGRYEAQDPEPGYWDAIIGPGKAIDTNKFFVIASDILCNACPKDPRVITTGPATLNPQNQKPYGLSFPMITIEDLVRVQKKLIDSLGIEKLFAVAGPSLGAMQTVQWAVSFPEMVERAIAVIGAGVETPAHVLSAVDFWAAPLKLDPSWNNGDYYHGEFPTRGMKEGLRLLTWHALSPEWSSHIAGRGVLTGTPMENFDDSFGIQEVLSRLANLRLNLMDPNHYLYIVKMVQCFSVRAQMEKIRAKMLLISAKSDLLMLPKFSLEATQELRSKGHDVEYFEIEGNGGHMDGIFAIEKAAETISQFLSK